MGQRRLRGKAIKLLEKNRNKIFYGLELGKGFLITTLKAYARH